MSGPDRDGPERASPDDEATDPTGSDRPADPDSSERMADPPDDATAADGTPSAAPESGDGSPLSELAGRIAARRERDAGSDADPPIEEFEQDLPETPSGEDDDPFEQMSVGEIDEEALWSSLESGGTAVGGDDAAEPLGDTDPDSGVESVEDADPEATEHVVPKSKYCQSCPYLDDPPSLSCTHEGTDIVEVVDSERFRVRNCPMVEE
jgi:hypothetical protein